MLLFKIQCFFWRNTIALLVVHFLAVIWQDLLLPCFPFVKAIFTLKTQLLLQYLLLPWRKPQATVTSIPHKPENGTSTPKSTWSILHPYWFHTGNPSEQDKFSGTSPVPKFMERRYFSDLVDQEVLERPDIENQIQNECK